MPSCWQCEVKRSVAAVRTVVPVVLHFFVRYRQASAVSVAPVLDVTGRIADGFIIGVLTVQGHRRKLIMLLVAKAQPQLIVADTGRVGNPD